MILRLIVAAAVAHYVVVPVLRDARGNFEAVFAALEHFGRR